MLSSSAKFYQSLACLGTELWTLRAASGSTRLHSDFALTAIAEVPSIMTDKLLFTTLMTFRRPSAAHLLAYHLRTCRAYYRRPETFLSPCMRSKVVMISAASTMGRELATPAATSQPCPFSLPIVPSQQELQSRRLQNLVRSEWNSK